MTGTRKLGLRVLCLVLTLVSLLSAAAPVLAAPATETAPKTMTAVVRLKAGGTVVGQMENGTKLNVLGEKGSYYKIDCYDMVGYIAKSQVELTDDNYYVSCKAGSSETRFLTYTDHTEALSLRESLYTTAKKQIGSRYVYGGSRPGGFDCSGLTSYLFKKHGMGIHRTASTQLQDGIVIPREALQVGDLVFFREAGNSHPATHVGIYVGDNEMIHSARHGVIRESLDSPYYKDSYLCARRVISTNPLQVAENQTGRSARPALTVNSVTGRTVHCCN